MQLSVMLCFQILLRGCDWSPHAVSSRYYRFLLLVLCGHSDILAVGSSLHGALLSLQYSDFSVLN